MADPALLELIRAFQADVGSALSAFLDRSKLADPFAWRASGLERTGTLAGAPPISYAFHGAGLWLRIGEKELDFDFGFDGRTGGFNDWWLTKYAEGQPHRFRAFTDPSYVRRALESAEAEGVVSRPHRLRQDSLLYLTSV